MKQEQHLTVASPGLYASSSTMKGFPDDDLAALDYQPSDEDFYAPGKEYAHALEEEQEKRQEDLIAIKSGNAPSFVKDAEEAWAKVAVDSEDEELKALIAKCIQKGITPEEYDAEREFYRLYLIDPKSVGLEVEIDVFDNLIQQWRAIISALDYRNQRELIFKQAAKGVDPEKYANDHQADWNDTFKTSRLERLKEEGLLKIVIDVALADELTRASDKKIAPNRVDKSALQAEKEVKGSLPIVLGIQVKSKEELESLKKEWALKAFIYYYKLQNKDYSKLSPEEQRTIKYIADTGHGPTGKEMEADVVAASELNDEERIGIAELLLGEELSQTARDAILKAHHTVGVGPKHRREAGLLEGSLAGLYNYTQAQLAEKISILEEGGITDAGKRRKLIETGIAALNNNPGNIDLPDDDEVAANVQAAIDQATGQSSSPPKETPPPLGNFLSKEGIVDLRGRLNSSMSALPMMDDHDIHAVKAGVAQLEKQSAISDEEAQSVRQRVAQREAEITAKKHAEYDSDKARKQRHDAKVNQIIEQLRLDPHDPSSRAIAESMIMDEQMSHQERITRHRTKVLEIDKVSIDPLVDARNALAWLQRYLRDILDNIEMGTLNLSETTAARLAAISKINVDTLNDVNAIKALVQELTDPQQLNIQKYFKQVDTEGQRRGSRYSVNSLDELVDLIAERGGDFRIGGKYEVRNARGEVNMGNLTAWMRDRLNNLRDNLSPDSPINVFSDISIPTAFRPIALSELVYVEGYFNKRKIIIEGDENRSNAREENVEDRKYSEIRDEIVTEAWLFGGNHSKDSTYRAGKEIEKGLAEMGKLYDDELFTKNRGRLLHIFSLRRSGNLNEAEIKKEDERGSVGLAIQRQLLAYYYMAEAPINLDEDNANDPKKRLLDGRNYFRETLGQEGMDIFFRSISASVLKSKDGFKTEVEETIDELKKQMRQLSLKDEQLKDDDGNVMEFNPEQDEVMQLLTWEKGRQKLADKISKRPLGKNFGVDKSTLDSIMRGGNAAEKVAKKLTEDINHMAWSDLNIFGNKKIKQRDLKMIQGAVADAISQPLNLSKNDREYARHWAFGFVYWTGIAARNDTAAQGFDAWSKLMNFKWYRTRGAQERTGAGNLQSLPDINRLSFTFWDGMNVQYAEEANLDGIELPPYLEKQYKERPNDPEVKKKIDAYKASLKAKAEHNIKLIDVMRNGHVSGKGVQAFDFEGNASKDFASIHLRQAYSLFEFIMDKQEFNLADIMKLNPTKGKLIMDHMKAQAFMGGPLKYAKYAFDQNDYLWDTLIRDWVKDDNGRLTYKTIRLRDYMFGEEVQMMGQQVFNRKGYDKHNDLMKNVTNPLTGVEEKLNKAWARPLVLDLVAREIQVYIDQFSSYGYYDVGKVKEVEAFLRMLSSDIKIIKDKKGRRKVIVSEPFVTTQEFKSMLKFINTSYGKMYASKFGLDFGLGFFATVGGLIGGLFKEVGSSFATAT